MRGERPKKLGSSYIGTEPIINVAFGFLLLHVEKNHQQLHHLGVTAIAATCKSTSSRIMSQTSALSEISVLFWTPRDFLLGPPDPSVSIQIFSSRDAMRNGSLSKTSFISKAVAMLIWWTDGGDGYVPSHSCITESVISSASSKRGLRRWPV